LLSLHAASYCSHFIYFSVFSSYIHFLPPGHYFQITHVFISVSIYGCVIINLFYRRFEWYKFQSTRFWFVSLYLFLSGKYTFSRFFIACARHARLVRLRRKKLHFRRNVLLFYHIFAELLYYPWFNIFISVCNITFLRFLIAWARLSRLAHAIGAQEASFPQA